MLLGPVSFFVGLDMLVYTSMWSISVWWLVAGLSIFCCSWVFYSAFAIFVSKSPTIIFVWFACFYHFMEFFQKLHDWCFCDEKNCPCLTYSGTTLKKSQQTLLWLSQFFEMHTSKHNLNSSKMLNNLQNLVLYKTLKTFSIISLTRGTPVESRYWSMCIVAWPLN